MVYEYNYGTSLIWLTSASVSFFLALTLFTCVCGCRKKIPKNELLGLAGLVKITNPDESVIFNSSTTNVGGTVQLLQLSSVTIEDTSVPDQNEVHDPNKRGSNTLATATRSLPDLPVDSVEASEKLWDQPENNADTNSDLYATVEDAGRKKRGITSRLTVESYTPSHTDDSLSPYAQVKEHPYDQLKQSEHPYAQVGPNGTRHNAPPNRQNSQDTNSTPSSSTRVEQEREEDTKSDEISDEIGAASAISGSVPANHDLPYMTPPIVQPQMHFSGDSVDSSKGYTSISVREPLSRIMGVRRQVDGDPHYATVSDDSDEMYAAIEERSQNTRREYGQEAAGGDYTSGSETYAQIAPLASQPSSNLTLALHRDSVSSGSTESLRKDKRVANSPLPQVPALDDMYAKVNKKRSPTSPEPRVNPQPDGPQSIPGYETVRSDPNYEELQPQTSQEPDYASLSRRFELSSLTDPNYESVGSSLDPPYERVNSLPGISNDPPDYEVICSRSGQAMESVADLYARVNKSPEKRYSYQE